MYGSPTHEFGCGLAYKNFTLGLGLHVMTSLADSNETCVNCREESDVELNGDAGWWVLGTNMMKL